MLPGSLRRHSYLLGRRAAKTALRQQMNLEQPEKIWVDVGVFGQPLVRAPAHAGMGISISHSADYGGAIAFDMAQPMAIDIEPLRRRDDQALLSQFTPAEIDRLNHVSQHPVSPLWLWTAKEALSKVMQTGLTVPLDLYEIGTIQQDGVFFVALFKKFLQYKTLSFRWRESMITIALPARTAVECPLHNELLPLNMN